MFESPPQTPNKLTMTDEAVRCGRQSLDAQNVSKAESCSIGVMEIVRLYQMVDVDGVMIESLPWLGSWQFAELKILDLIGQDALLETSALPTSTTLRCNSPLL